MKGKIGKKIVGENVSSKESKNFTLESQEKGITLVALVITIIILIILATVTLNFAFGENGLVKKAEYAKELYTNSAIAEEQGINDLVSQLEDLNKNQLYEDEIGKIRTARDNLNNALSLIQTAEGAATEESEIAHQIRILTLQIMNGNYSTEEIQAIALEINDLLNEMERIATETKYNGMNIVDGSLMGDNAYKIELTTREITLEIEGIKRENLELDQIGNLTNKEDAANLQQIVNEALSKLSNSRTTFGAEQNMYESLIEYYSELEKVLLQDLSVEETKDNLAVSGMNQLIKVLELIKNNEMQTKEATMNSEDKEVILIAINEYIDEIDIIVEDLEFQGQKLLDGSYKNIPNLNSIGLSQNGTEFYVDLSTDETINQSINECENAITKIEGIINNL